MNLEERVRRLEDLHEIQQVLGLYCRAVDRLDLDLLRSVYHSDATDAHGTFVGSAWEFAEYVMQVLGRNAFTSHAITNLVIELDGDVASTESIYLAATRVPGGQDSVAAYFGERYAERARREGTLGEEQEHICGGRYLDRFEKRDGAWKIAARSITNEWNQCRPSAQLWEGRLADLNLPGARDRSDPVYANSVLPPFPLGQR